MELIDLLFLLVLALTLVQRFVESISSRTNQAILSQRGFAIREPKSHRSTIKLLQVMWVISMLIEWHFQIIPVPFWLRCLALCAFIVAQVLRIWTLKSLGEHWSIEVFAPEKEDTPSLGPLTEAAMISGKTSRVEKGLRENLFVENGAYKFVRHPNMLAQIIEIAALPLCGGAALTGLIFSILNNHILNKHIDLEESWLFSRPGYHELFYHKSRFIPF